MALPTDSKQAWPPPSVPMVDFAVWGEWYAGAFAAAGTQYSRVPLTSGGYVERMTGGFVHRHANITSGTATMQRAKSQSVHCPLAADIAMTSADLLFGEMPDLRLEANKATQKRLDALCEEMGLQNLLLEAAEVCAAIGGSYLRVSWDKAVAEVPFLSAVDAELAVPEFRSGRMTAVTFWRKLESEGKGVLRHLERYEPGVILHGLYKGDERTLGDAIPLEGHPETKDLPESIEVPAEVPGRLLAWHVPNVRPRHGDRRSYLGRADISGAETFLDALDEVYSSLMRDVRLGQSRILVPSDTLEAKGGRGAGRDLDLDREVFTELEMPPEKLPPTHIQGEIRTEQHLAAVVDLIKQIVSKAGYSPQTYGLDIQGQAESGTALRIREQKTHRTLGRKRRYWEAALRLALHALLVVDVTQFGSRIKPARPEIVWPEEAMGPGEMAQTLLDLRNAEAASIESRVRLLNPGWDDAKIAAEVERIRQESGSLVPEPAF